MFLSHGSSDARALLQAVSHISRKLASEPYIATNAEARRLVLARQAGAERDLIASASVQQGILSVWSCEPKLYEVPVRQIPALANLSASSIEDFRVSESGSRIHWNDADVDLNLDTLREHVHPEERKQNERSKREQATSYCRAIRAFRLEKKLTQSAIPGLTARQVRRLEQGAAVPHSASLEKLAKAHGLSTERYLGELAKRSDPKRRGSAERAPRLRSD